jgi:hypothetical protein
MTRQSFDRNERSATISALDVAALLEWVDEWARLSA